MRILALIVSALIGSSVSADTLFSCTVIADPQGEYSKYSEVFGRLHDDQSQGVFMFHPVAAHGKSKMVRLFPILKPQPGEWTRYSDPFTSANENYRTAILKDIRALTTVYVDTFNEDGGLMSSTELKCKTTKAEGTINILGPEIAKIEFQIKYVHSAKMATLLRIDPAMIDKAWLDLDKSMQARVYDDFVQNFKIGADIYYSINILDPNEDEGNDILSTARENQQWTARVTGFTVGHPLSMEFSSQNLVRLR